MILVAFCLKIKLYIYIYCHSQTDCFVVSQLFSVSRHVGRLKLGRKPTQLYVRLSIRPLGQQAYHVGLVIIRYHEQQQQHSFVYILYLTGYQSAQFVRRALHYVSSSWKFLRQSAQPSWGSVYIVIHRLTISLYHNSSVWLDTLDAWSWDRNPPNFTFDLVSDRSANYNSLGCH